MSGPYCPHCGSPISEDDHAACAKALVFEPPRYCAACRSRLVVQVTPRGWSARCKAHGVVTSVS